MALHVRCFEVRSDGGVLFAVLQCGPLPCAPGADPPIGLRVLLSRRLDRKGAVEHRLGMASLNVGAELVRIPEGVSSSEVADLERQIKEAVGEYDHRE